MIDIDHILTHQHNRPPLHPPKYTPIYTPYTYTPGILSIDHTTYTFVISTLNNTHFTINRPRFHYIIYSLSLNSFSNSLSLNCHKTEIINVIISNYSFTLPSPTFNNIINKIYLYLSHTLTKSEILV